MSRIARLRSFLSSLFLRSRMERGMEAELRFHVDSRTDNLIAEGVPAAEAARRARTEFGDTLRWKERARELRGVRLIDECRSDLRYGLRLLRRSSAFAIAAILSMALGIGANAIVFSLVNTIILKSLPLRDSDQLVLFARSRDAGTPNQYFPYPYYQDLLAATDALSGAVATCSLTASAEIEGQAEQVTGEMVSGNYFDMLGIRPQLGRLAVDDSSVVISHRFWQRRFGGDPAVIGHTIRVNTHALTIAGITQPDFHGLEPEHSPDIRVSIRLQPLINGSRSRLASRTDWCVSIAARLKPGVTRAQADERLKDGFARYLKSVDPKASSRLMLIDGAGGRSPLREQFKKPLLALVTLAGFVLLFVCVNVANLILARSSAQRAEVSMRYALGAGVLRIMRQSIMETSVLAVFAGLTSIPPSIWGARRLLSLIAGSDSVLDIALDLRVLAFFLIVSFLVAAICGVAPAVYAARVNLIDGLKTSRQALSDRAFVRKILVATQIALSLMLLVGAGLFVRTLSNLRTTGFGFDTDHLILLTIDFRLAGAGPKEGRLFYDDVLSRISSLPEIRSAAFALLPLLGESGWGSGLTLDDGVHDDAPGPMRNAVGVGYFRTIGTPLRSGREFMQSDSSGQLVAMVNESFARKYFGAGSALGRRIGPGGRGGSADYTIVGVTQDGKGNGVREDIGPVWYVPYDQLSSGNNRLTLHARARGDAARAISSVKTVIATMDKRVVVSGERTIEEQIEHQVRAERLLAILGTFFGSVVLLLASVGLYGVMTYVTSVRKREFGIMMALGARSHFLLMTVLAQSLRLIAIGVAAGMILTFCFFGNLRSLLSGVEPTDTGTLIGSAALIIAVTVIAAYFPARWVTRVDPVESLRPE